MTAITYFDLMPCSRFEQMTFSEKEFSFKYLQRVWGMALSYLGSGGDKMWINVDKAKKLAEKYNKGKIDSGELMKSVKKESKDISVKLTEHRSKDYFYDLLFILSTGLITTGVMNLDLIKTGGLDFYPALIIIFLIVLLDMMKLPLSKFLVNVGFKSLVKSFLDKKIK